MAAAAQQPVTLGCTRSRSVETGGFAVAEMQFPPGLSLPAHSHDRATIAVILRGSFQELARRDHACQPGSVLIEPAGEPHGNRFDSKGAIVLTVQPDPSRLELLEPFLGLLSATDHRRDPSITGLARRAARELTAKDALAPLALEGLVLQLLADLHRSNRRAAETAVPHWLERARDLVHDRHPDPVRLGDLAAAVGVHPVHLSRTFRAYYGLSVSEYARRLRLEHAARLLAHTRRTIAEIATEAGFYDQSHFTRTFRDHYGATPQRYRLAAGT